MKHIFSIIAILLASLALSAQEAPKYGDIPEGERISTRHEYNAQRREAAQVIQRLEDQSYDVILSELDRMVFLVQAFDDQPRGQEVDSWGRQVIFPDNIYYSDLSDFYRPVLVKTMDSGVDENHSGWRQDGVWLPEANYTGDPNAHWHGTHVAGIIWQIVREVSRQNGNILMKDVQSLNSQGAGSMTQAANAIETERTQDAEYRAKGYAVTYNMSWGYAGPPSSTFEQVLSKSVAIGDVFVCANGNTGAATPSYPASSEMTISTAALDQGLTRASYSTIGEFTDVAMPGTNVLSYLPGDSQGYASGTSMASPFTTGVIVLGQAKWGEVLADQGNALLYAGAIAKDIAPDGWDQMTGSGVLFVQAVRNTDPCTVPGITCDTPPDDPGDDPGPPDDPDGSYFTAHFDAPYVMRWKVTGESGWRILTMQELQVTILSLGAGDQEYRYFADFLPTYFRNRGIEVPVGMDVTNANFWVGQFLQYIAEQAGFTLQVDHIVNADETTGGHFYAEGFKPLPASQALNMVRAIDTQDLQTQTGVKLVEIH